MPSDAGVTIGTMAASAELTRKAAKWFLDHQMRNENRHIRIMWSVG
jgi:hypothetical protein